MNRFDAFAESPSATVSRFSSEVDPAHLARIAVEPTAGNGLRATSRVMIDKAAAVPRAKVGRAFGRLGEEAIRALAFLGLGD
jgi:mRNA interferase MazF